MSNETEGRSGAQQLDSKAVNLGFLSEIDAQYPVAAWFVKAELFMFLLTTVLAVLGKGMLLLPGFDIWMFHDFYLLTWMFMYTLGATGIGVGIMYLLWRLFAK